MPAVNRRARLRPHSASRATVYRVLAESTPESDLAFDATSALAVRTAAVSLRAIPVTEGEHSSYVAGS